MRAGKQSWAHPLLVLYVAPSDVGLTRAGIVVGKRVGGAVVRNRVRRRIREALRLRHADLPPGYDLVFIAREPSARAAWSELRAAVDRLLRRAKLLKQFNS